MLRIVEMRSVRMRLAALLHIDELRAPYNLSRDQTHEMVRDGKLPRPRGYGRHARYGPEHAAALRVGWTVNNDLTASLREILVHVREEGISLTEYVRRREAHIRNHGLGYV